MCDNSTVGLWSESDPDNQLLRKIIFITAGIFAAIIGASSNLITFISLLSSKTFRGKPITILILNICVSDFCYCLFVMPIHLMNNLDPKLREMVLDHHSFSLYLLHVPAITDWSTMSFIALERYCRICRSIQYDGVFSFKNTVLINMSVWIFPILLFAAAYHGIIDDLYLVCCHHRDDDHYVCKPLSSTGAYVYIMYSCLPFVIIIISYSAICFKFLGAQRWRNLTRQQMPDWVNKTESHIMKTSLIVVIVYMIGVLPLPILNIMSMYGSGMQEDLRMFFRCLYMQVYYINNLVFMLGVNGYRQACLDLYRRIHPSIAKYDSGTAIEESNQSTDIRLGLQGKKEEGH